jgi:hypothetical protein
VKNDDFDSLNDDAFRSVMCAADDGAWMMIARRSCSGHLGRFGNHFDLHPINDQVDASGCMARHLLDSAN